MADLTAMLQAAAGNAAAPTGYQISRSLRFNSADSAYLSRTPASASNRKTWTWSGWAKRGLFQSFNTLFLGGTNGTTDATYTGILFRSNTVQVSGYNTVWRRTTALFRDPSSWYHVVVSLDTTAATAADRVKVYVNGVEMTSFSISNDPSLNDDLGVNQADGHRVGYGLASEYYDGLMAEIHFVDGQALTPSSFGEINATTGVWSPIAYAGTYGTNGFYLDFSDNTSTTTLGYDAAGSNDWTTNNFSVTAGAGNDSLVDTPTLYGTDTGAGGEVRGNYATWNPFDKSIFSGALTYTNGNLNVQATISTLARATIYVSSGKWYAEVTIVSLTGGAAVGIATASSLYIPGYSADSYGYRQTGDKYNSDSSSAYGATYSANDVIGIALDLDAGTLTFYKNGASQGTAFTGISGLYTFAVGGTGSGADITFALNAGQRPFAHTAPSGFKALVTTNLPDPTVVQGDDYFNTKLWTGTGASQSVTGVGFQPDIVWAKDRNNVVLHILQDAVRGANKLLYPSLTQDEITAASGFSFDTDGFTVGTAITELNVSGRPYVAWNWNAGGSNATNTDGTITSTVRANTTAGFSIVSYTGAGPGSSANEKQVGHGLGVAPKLVIIKDRDATTNWFVYTTVIDGTNDRLYLNTTDAAANVTMNAPTSSVFYIGGSLNTSGNDYVAYCFAAIPNFSAFGKYTGNGSADGPFVYLGFRPAWLLLKETSGASNWILYDSVRNTFNAVDDILIPNTSDAESSYSAIDFVSNGFKFRSSSFNSSGATYIYAAFAENPFKYALAR